MRELKGLMSKADLTGKADEPMLKVYNGTLHIIFYKPLRAALRAITVTSLNRLEQQLNKNMANDKEKNGNIKRKTTEPTDKAVRPSSRGNQNLEAADASNPELENTL